MVKTVLLFVIYNKKKHDARESTACVTWNMPSRINKSCLLCCHQWSSCPCLVTGYKVNHKQHVYGMDTVEVEW